MRKHLVAAAAVVTVAAAVFLFAASRAGLPLSDLWPFPDSAATVSTIKPAAARGERLAVFAPTHAGLEVMADDRPLIANVAIADLDGDGRVDIVAADAAANRIVWLQQTAAGGFVEQSVGEVAGPAHVTPIDLDADRDVDIVVASLGVLFPNNARIGAVLVFENLGRGRFQPRTIIERAARVADVEAGDLDGDGDLDLAVAHFGYDQGETRWLENLGGWRFQSHLLQQLAGPINAVIADADGDRDLDIISLVSQDSEEIYVFANDGRGKFSPTRIFGAANKDFGSSWISVADLDRDGDADVLYSNGDAFDYAPPKGRNWNGVQWLENTGGLRFTYHRLVDYPGASSPQAGDVDGDGDLDIVVVSAYNDWASAGAQSMIWLQNDGRMHFTMRDLASSPTHLLTVAIGDINGDGRADLVTGGAHTSWPYDRLSRLMIWMNQWPAGSPQTP
jgi:FG-GAP-like repeat